MATSREAVNPSISGVIPPGQHLVFQADCEAPWTTIWFPEALTIQGVLELAPSNCHFKEAWGLVVRAPAIHLSSSAVVRMPNGSDAPGVFTFSCSPGKSLLVSGMNGGFGASIILDAPRVTGTGTLVVGNGGAGADVVLEGCGGLTKAARGGNGGESGTVLTPRASLPQGTVILGGVGGEGGSVKILQGKTLSRTRTDYGTNGTDIVSPNGGDAHAVGENGAAGVGTSEGVSGGDAYAYGGRGAIGYLTGGRGGDALAEGGHGGPAAHVFAENAE
ncbi:MAG TPA: hypothetical protein VI796_03380, partial [Candidatus Thermoplasmatota archaeon]|nr:hypothetical protein [Candidatus Thermoplasmatota archaeon]